MCACVCVASVAGAYIRSFCHAYVLCTHALDGRL